MQPTGLEGTAGCGEKAAASRVPSLAPSAPTRGSRVPFLAPSAPTEMPCFLAVNRVDPARRKGTSADE